MGRVAQDGAHATADTPSPSVAPSGHASRFPCVDGLRAVAALSVFVYHASSVFFQQDHRFVPNAVLDWLNPLGFFGVAVFFVISGFLLFRPYVLAAFDTRPGPRLLPFWKRRFFRIFPAYWVALAVVVFVLGQATFASVGEALTSFGLLQNYRYRNPVGLGVAWTLVIEVSFYLVLPGLAWLIRTVSDRSPDRRFKLRVHLVALMLLAGVGLAVRCAYFLNGSFGTPARGSWFTPFMADTWLLAYLDWFALGMALAVGSAWLAVGGSVPRVVELLGRVPALSWLLALECYWIVVQLGLGRFSSGVPSSPVQSILLWTCLGLAGVFFVLPVVFGPQLSGGIRRVLRARVAVMLGVVSYGIYLWHLPVWLQSVEWLPSGVPMAVQFAIVLAVTVLIAVASWEIIERPIIRWSSGNAVSLWKGHTIARVADDDDRRNGDETRPGARLGVAGVVIVRGRVGRSEHRLVGPGRAPSSRCVRGLLLATRGAPRCGTTSTVRTNRSSDHADRTDVGTALRDLVDRRREGDGQEQRLQRRAGPPRITSVRSAAGSRSGVRIPGTAGGSSPSPRSGRGTSGRSSTVMARSSATSASTRSKLGARCGAPER